MTESELCPYKTNKLSILSHTPSRQWSSKQYLSPGNGVLISIITSSVKERQALFLACDFHGIKAPDAMLST